MVEARLNVNVDTKKAQEDFDKLNTRIKDQELLVASLKLQIAEYEAGLSDLSGTQRMMRESSIKNLNESLKVQKADLAQAKVEAKQLKDQLKEFSKTQGTTKIKAAEFNETLLKNRDISAGLSKITGGLSYQLQSFGKLFISVGRGIKKSTLALSGFKKALIATGIGAFVVLLGTLIANFDKIKALFTGVTSQQKDLLDSQQKTAQASQQQLDNISATENILKLQGKSEQDILNLKAEQTKQTISALEAQLLTQKTIKKQQIATAERNKKILDGILKFILAPLDAVVRLYNKIPTVKKLALPSTTLANAVFNVDKIKEEADAGIKETETQLTKLKNSYAGYQLQINKINKDASDKRLKEQKAAYEKELKALQDRLNKEIDIRVAANTKVGNIRREFFEKNLGESLQADLIRQERERERIIKEIEDSKATAAAKRLAIAEVNKFYDDQDAKTKAEWNEKRKEDDINTKKQIFEYDQKIEEQKIALRNKTFANAVKLAGEESRLGKAILVAKTILNAKEQMMEIKKTFAQAKSTVDGSILKGAEAQAAVAAGTAETAKIGFPQNIPMLIAYAAQAISVVSAIKSAVGKAKSVASSVGAGSGGGASIEAPKITTAAPSFNIVGSTPENQLAQTIAQQTGQPVKAYVVSGDVTTAQGLDRNIIRESALG